MAVTDPTCNNEYQENNQCMIEKLAKWCPI